MGIKALGESRETEAVKAEIKAGERLGPVVLGDTDFIFKAGFTKYYIPYSEIKRLFRRVKVLPIKNKKTGENSLQVEYVVLMNREKELAEIQLPGKKTAEDILLKVSEKNPEIETVCPRKLQKKNDRNEENIVL